MLKQIDYDQTKRTVCRSALFMTSFTVTRAIIKKTNDRRTTMKTLTNIHIVLDIITIALNSFIIFHILRNWKNPEGITSKVRVN